VLTPASPIEPDESGGTIPDAVLAARMAAGDEAALGSVYDRHAELLFGATVRFLGDREVAAEVVQDAFIVVWRQAARFDPRAGSLLGWLLAIARNRAIDRLRAESRRPSWLAVSLDAGADEPRPASGVRPAIPSRQQLELRSGAGAPDPAHVAGQRWLQAVVRSTLSELPDDERRVLLLAYAEELSQSEIAERLGWPLGTVKSRTRRAMARLRTTLGAVPDLVGELAIEADLPRGQR
jgi:RNA polymerase sigma-70 factor, ECF subfamily